jgi:hypothetical protein
MTRATSHFLLLDQVPPGRTPEERSTEFVPVGATPETTSAETLLVAAYVLMWAALLVFVFLTWRKQNRIETRIQELDATLRRAAPKG